MRKIEASAKTVEQAIEKGLQMVARDRDEVVINVINEGSMLRKAVVEIVTFADEEERTRYVAEASATSRSTDGVVLRQCDSTDACATDDVTDTDREVMSFAREFVEGLMHSANITGTAKETVRDGEKIVNIADGDTHKMIGFHGEGLEAIQYVMNTAIHNKFPKYRDKIYIDIEGYRRRRKETMVDLAEKMAKKVILNKRSIKLEPMSAFERKMIHTHLQNIEHVSTHSEGTEPDRRLIIDYVE